MAQTECSNRSFSVASVMAFVNVHDSIEQRIANSVLLHRQSKQQVTGQSVIGWLGTVQSISGAPETLFESFQHIYIDSSLFKCGTDAVLCLHSRMVSKLCGAEDEPDPSDESIDKRQNVFADILQRAAQKSLDRMAGEVRAGLSEIDKMGGELTADTSTGDVSLQAFLASATASERLQSWIAALSSFWVSLSSDSEKGELHEESLRISVNNIVKAFSQGPELDGWAEMTVAYKWVVRLGLGWSVSARRMAWLFSSGSEHLRICDLASGLVLRSVGTIATKIKAILRLNGVSAGRRWSYKAIEQSLRPFVFLAVDTAVMQTSMLQKMFDFDDGLRDVLLRTTFERAQQYAHAVAKLTAHTINKHPAKSALALAVHVFQRSQVGIWLTNIQRSWLSTLWYSSVAGRESARLAVMALPHPQRQAALPHSIARTAVSQVVKAICESSSGGSVARNAVGSGGARNALSQLFHATDFDGSAVLDSLAVNSNPKAVPLTACLLSAGTPYEKVAGTLTVLGQDQEADMSFAVHSWLTAFGSVPIGIIDQLNAQIGAVCGGDDEREHKRVQREWEAIVGGAALPVAKKYASDVERLASVGSCTAERFIQGASQILEPLLQDIAAAWIPLFPEVRGAIGLHTSTVGRHVVEVFGKPEFEVGKDTGVLTAKEAYELAVSLGCTDQLLIVRMVWMCDAGGGAPNVWCRDFATTLILLSSGHHDDKRHLILQLNGMTSVETSWNATGSSRQLRRDQLFKALRPLLFVAMDVAAAHLQLCGGLFALSEPLVDSLLRSVKLRTMVYLEDVCRQLATPTNTVSYSQANQKLYRWLDRLSASWLQLASHVFGSGGHATSAREPPSWSACLRPDPVGFTAGASPLTRGLCAPVGGTVKDEDKLQTVSSGQWDAL